jgi:N-acetylglucosaminyldiphosphoundecaprenol N-acetyl-beta-D-mannosaminyltransferase
VTVRPVAVLLGTPIDDVTMEEALDVIASMVEVGRASGRVHQIATVNVDFVVNAAADDELRRIMRRTDLSIPDGMGIVWGARLVRTPIRERTAGADLVPALARRAASDGWRLGLFGGAPGVAERAADVLREAAPGVEIVVVPAPMVGADGTIDAAVADEVLNDLRAVHADVIGVALGNPKQERWIARYGQEVGAPVCIGIGGTLDFLTGATVRAPMWMQRAGLEWIHRALSEPRRLIGRYAHDLVVFGPALGRQMWSGRARRRRGVVLTRGEAVSDSARMVELAGLRHLDNAAIADVVAAQRSAHLAGAAVTVAGASAVVLDDARRLGVASFVAGEQSRPRP